MIKVDGTWLSLSRAKKIEALLIYLAVEQARPHSPTALDGVLFPELSDKAARTNLRQTITRLQKSINNKQAEPPYLLLSGETLQFNLASVTYVDLAEFQAKLKACADHTAPESTTSLACVESLKEAVALYRGPFLEGFFIQDSEPFERWLEIVREQVEQQMLTALQRLADYYEQRGDYQPAVGFIQHQLTLAPWQEKSHRQLMRLLARQGHRGAAIQQYQPACQMLWDKLGV